MAQNLQEWVFRSPLPSRKEPAEGMHSKGNIEQIKKDVINASCVHMTKDRNQDRSGYEGFFLMINKYIK